jgi:hypothetical protein
VLYAHLQIDGDPTFWWLKQPIDESTLTGSGAIQHLDTVSPVSGTLVLSVGVVASFALADPAMGAIPTDADRPAPLLYLPTPGGFPGVTAAYSLPANTDLAALINEITTAMSANISIAVGLVGGGANRVVLNGALLSFAVICPAKGATPPPGA